MVENVNLLGNSQVSKMKYFLSIKQIIGSLICTTLCNGFFLSAIDRDTFYGSHRFVVDSEFHINLSATEKSNIYELVHDMGSLSWFSLLKKAFYYKRIGDSLDHVDPLQFLGYILSDPALKRSLGNIMGDSMKRRSFLNGLSNKLGRLKSSGAIDKEQVELFAKYLGKDSCTLVRFFAVNDWTNFVASTLR